MILLSVRRLAMAAAALVVVFAGSARAQVAECIDPSAVPEAVYVTILDQSSFAFGDLSQKVCNSITRKGVSTCKSQVNAAAKCFKKSISANASIANKQCAQLSSPSDRRDCKQGVKINKNALRDQVDLSRSQGLDTCGGEFENALLGTCLVGVSM